ncbi:MAG TPA: S8 family serine peptidase [Acidimicrobiales bacterium]|nr:S8 family serine peptidase [Acidimicrobiales bacterium]
MFLATVTCCTFVAAVAAVAVHRPPEAAPAQAALVHRGLLTLASVPAAPAQRVVGLATFRRPAAARAAAAPGGVLAGLGVQAAAFKNLPLAAVVGTKDELATAVHRGAALDVYPDQALHFLSAESTAAVHADQVRAAGITGKGVGVAIVDTGVDATHPDLADHVTHNLKLVGPEILDVLGGKQGPGGTIAIPMDSLPYDNSDTSSGHGTHVAGIVAADGHTGASQVGMAPDANIIGYGTGDLLSVFMVLAAFDDILTHKDAWGIRVVNNSWGASGRMFDPNHPINVATKALHDAGLVVVFAAGNDGEEGTMNPYSVAPWVIAAGSGTVTKQASPFTSGGYEYDAAEPVAVPADRHQHFEGDRIGIYHPDVSAPGSDIVSSGTPTGIGVLSPSLPGGTATLSGTSMASPHLAGLAADLLQARPSLTPDQVREVLQVTAVPLTGDAPFWHSGYGFADAAAAVALVGRADFSQAMLDSLQAAADARVLAARPFVVRSMDLWSFNPLPVTVAGLESHSYNVAVAPGASAVKAIATYPSLGLVGVNPFDWKLTVVDAKGHTLGTSTPSGSTGVSSVSIDLRSLPDVGYGTWKLVVSGDLGAADTDALIGNVVTVAFSQVQARPQLSPAAAPSTPAGPAFAATGTQPLYFQHLAASPATAGVTLPLAVPSPEGCETAAGAPTGVMGGARGGACATGLVGWPVTHVADTPAEFSTSAPLAQPLVVGGTSTLTLWLVDPAAPVWSAAAVSRISYQLDAVDGSGTATPLAAGDMDRRITGAEEVGPDPVRADYTFPVTPATVPAGSVLRLRLRFSGAYTATMRMLFGGPYADSGLQLGIGRLG